MERALTPDPADRFHTAGELQAALETLHPSALADTPASPGGSAWRTGRTWALLATVLLVAALAVSLWRWGGAGGFGVQAALYRVSDAGIRERLFDGDVVRVGDFLTLTLEASEPVHVYVLNRDESGRTVLLFPIPGAEPGNPLSPGVEHRLPGTIEGRAQSWQMTSRGGTERFLIVASRDPVPEMEEDLAALPTPAPGVAPGYAPLSERSERRLRLAGGLAPEPSTGTEEDLVSRFAALGDEASRAERIWIRRVTLRNP